MRYLTPILVIPLLFSTVFVTPAHAASLSSIFSSLTDLFGEETADEMWTGAFGVNSLPPQFGQVAGINTGEPANISLILGETGNASIQVPSTADVEVQNLPEWVTISRSGDTITFTATPTELGHGRWDVVVDGTTTHELTVNVYSASEDIATVAAALSAENIEELVPAGGVITHTNPIYFPNADGVHTTVCFAYYTNYRVNQQIITVDLATGLVGVNDTTSFDDEAWHLSYGIYAGNGVSYIGGSKTPSVILTHKYDTKTHTFTKDVIPPTDYYKRGNQPSVLNIGTNGKIYGLGKDPNDNDSSTVAELDPADDSYRFLTGIPAAGDPKTIAADDTYVYLLTEPYQERRLTAVNLDTEEQIILQDGVSTGIWIKQVKHGVLAQDGSQWYWLYGGQIIPATDLNNYNGTGNPPWGADETDLNAYQAELPVDRSPRIATVKQEAMIPPGDNTTGRFWYIDPNDPAPVYLRDFVSVDIPNVNKYPAIIKFPKALPNGKVLFAHKGYTGYSLYDPLTNTLESHQVAEGRLSNYTISVDGNNAYISGYPSSPLLKYDFTQPWDNEITSDWDPNEAQAFTNPEYLGYIGSFDGINIKKSYDSAVGVDGKIYFGGQVIRDGDGGGVVSYDPITDDTFLYRNGYETDAVNNLVSVGQYIVSSSQKDGGVDHPMRVKVIDTNLGTVVRTIEPASDIDEDGRMVADGNGEPFVYILTNVDNRTTTRILKINVETGVVVYDHSYPVGNYAGHGNDEGYADLLFADDGFLYAIMGSTNTSPWLVRIDPETGYVVPTHRFTNSAGRFDALGNDLYMAGTYQGGVTTVRRVKDFKVVYNLSESGGSLRVLDGVAPNNSSSGGGGSSADPDEESSSSGGGGGGSSSRSSGDDEEENSTEGEFLEVADENDNSISGDSHRAALLLRIQQLTELIATLQAQLNARRTNSYTTISTQLLRPLGIGMKGADVKALQQKLNAKGYYISQSGDGAPGKETTYFGPATLAALKRYQCAEMNICSGTPATTGYGNLGPMTRESLR